MWLRPSLLRRRIVRAQLSPLKRLLLRVRTSRSWPAFAFHTGRPTAHAHAPVPNLDSSPTPRPVFQPRATIDDARRVLRESFGHHDFRPEQEPVVSRILAGEDALVMWPMASGRYLSYIVRLMTRRRCEPRLLSLKIVHRPRFRCWLKLPTTLWADPRRSLSSSRRIFPTRYCVLLLSICWVSKLQQWCSMTLASANTRSGTPFFRAQFTFFTFTPCYYMIHRIPPIALSKH